MHAILSVYTTNISTKYTARTAEGQDLSILLANTGRIENALVYQNVAFKKSILNACQMNEAFLPSTEKEWESS